MTSVSTVQHLTKSPAVPLDQLSYLASARSRIYRVLGAIYVQSPNEALLRDLLEEERFPSPASLWRDDVLPTRLTSGLKAIRTFANELGFHDIGKLTEALSIEYVRLFRAVKHGYSPPPPYESVYLGEGVVFGQTTSSVRRQYEESGFMLAEHQAGEPPDHIGYELQFMHCVCAGEAEAWRVGRREKAWASLNLERAFLERHLRRWVTKFCDNVRMYDRLGFYRSWADATQGWIAFDYQLIDDYLQGIKSDHREVLPETENQANSF